MFEQELSDSTTEVVSETVVVKKVKKTSGKKKVQRNEFPAHLKREEQIIYPEGELDGLVQIGQDVTEILAFVEPSLHVKRIIRPRMADKKNVDKGVLQASNYFLERVQTLYEIERQARDEQCSYQQRFQLRQQKSIPILKYLESWLTKQYADLGIAKNSY